MPVATLLRQMKIAAVKLGLNELEAWVQHELAGYPSDDLTILPDYRRQTGTPVGLHVVRGWEPLTMNDPASYAFVSYRPITQSLGSIEDLLADRREGILFFQLDGEIEKAILDFNGGRLRQVGLQMDPSRLSDVIDAVRNRILDWALDMERAGVMGEDMSFSNHEKKVAQGVSITIGTVNGGMNTGDASGANARITLHGDDNSNNQNIPESLFANLREAIQQGVNSADEQTKMLSGVDAMEKAKGTPGFVKAYRAFISTAADHMQLVTPFIGELTGLL